MGVEVEVEVEVKVGAEEAEDDCVDMEEAEEDADEYEGLEMPNWAVYWYAWVASTMSSMP